MLVTDAHTHIHTHTEREREMQLHIHTHRYIHTQRHIQSQREKNNKNVIFGFRESQDLKIKQKHVFKNLTQKQYLLYHAWVRESHNL